MLISDYANNLSKGTMWDVVTFFLNFIVCVKDTLLLCLTVLYSYCTAIVFRNLNGLFTVQEAALTRDFTWVSFWSFQN